MKRILLALLASIVMCMNANAQEKMVVQKSDGTKVEYNVEDIAKVFFYEILVNPCNPQGKVGEAVDLGLSCLWATWNVGASSLYDKGGLYGWGDPDGTKASEDLADYPSANPPSNICGTKYDIARKRWGGDWRMPTITEIRELITNCKWYLESSAGIEYISAEGPNGKSIIFPLTGFRIGTELITKPNFYWSGTLKDESSDYSNGLFLDAVKGEIYDSAFLRYTGMAVRPVCDKKVVITATTGSASNITETGATVSGTVNGAESSVTCGIIYGTSSSISASNGTKKTTTSKGSFSVTLSGLSPTTTYFYRAFAYIDGEYILGEIKNFTTQTPATSGYINGHEWVDLGLPSGTRWATCNVGASSSYELGDMLSWGGTIAWKFNDEVKNKDIPELKACGIIDDSGNLSPEYDAATVNWGDGWRMPTKEDFQELLDYCTWTYQYSTHGYEIKGRNGKKIFLPGRTVHYTNIATGYVALYISSTPDSTDKNNAYHLYFEYCDDPTWAIIDRLALRSDFRHLNWHNYVRPVTK